jgi:hypothetical protein
MTASAQLEIIPLLAMFGAIVWLLAQETAGGALGLAAIVWFAVSTVLWRLRRQMRIAKS